MKSANRWATLCAVCSPSARNRTSMALAGASPGPLAASFIHSTQSLIAYRPILFTQSCRVLPPKVNSASAPSLLGAGHRSGGLGKLLIGCHVLLAGDGDTLLDLLLHPRLDQQHDLRDVVGEGPDGEIAGR